MALAQKKEYLFDGFLREGQRPLKKINLLRLGNCAMYKPRRHGKMVTWQREQAL